nr:MAG TPA: hypothetical protein [Bacteriophage sp.]
MIDSLHRIYALDFSFFSYSFIYLLFIFHLYL